MATVSKQGKPRDKGGGEADQRPSAASDSQTSPALLPGWVKMTSRTKHRDYFYNERLKVSQWHRPTIDDEIKILVDQEKTKINDKGRGRNILTAKRRLEREDEVEEDGSVERAPGGTKNEDRSSHRKGVPDTPQSSSKRAKVEGAVPKTHALTATGTSASRVKMKPEAVKEGVVSTTSSRLVSYDESPTDENSREMGFEEVVPSDEGNQTGGPVHVVKKESKRKQSNKKEKLAVKDTAKVCYLAAANSKKDIRKDSENRTESKSREDPVSKPSHTEWQKFLAKYKPRNINNSNSTRDDRRGADKTGRQQDTGVSTSKPSSESTQATATRPARPDVPTQTERGEENAWFQPSVNASMASLDSQHEEAMDVEDYPEDYIKLIIDIHEIREDFQIENNESGQLASTFLETSANTKVSSTETSKQKQMLYIVIDTNVLMNSLKFVSDLRTHALPGHSGPCIVIPWVVMTELDHIKDNKRQRVTEDTQTKARKAVKYLHERLEARDPLLVGQKPAEAKQKFEELGDADNNDDKVLQCCVQWKAKYPPGAVFLLTGDIHLRSKALILGLVAYSEKSLLNWINTEKCAAPQNNIKQSKHVIDKSSTALIPSPVPSRSPSHHVRTESVRTTSSPGPEPQTLPALRPCSVTGHHGDRELGGFHAARAEPTSPQEAVMDHSAHKSRHLAPHRVSMDTKVSRSHGASSSSLADRAVTGAGARVVRPSVQKRRNHDNPLQAAKTPRVCLQQRVLQDTRKLLQAGLSTFLENHMKHTYDDIWKLVVFRKPPWSLEDVLVSIKKHWMAVFGDLLGRNNSGYVQDLLSALRRAKDSSWSSVHDVLSEAVSMCQQFLQHIRMEKMKTMTTSCMKKELSSEEVEILLMELDRNSPSVTEAVTVIQEAFQTVWEHILATSTDTRRLLGTGQVSAGSRRQLVEDFASFCRHVAAIHRHYQTVLGRDPDPLTPPALYSDLCSALQAFAKLYSFPSWHDLHPGLLKAFDDPSRRPVLQNGFAQLENLMGDISQCNDLLQPEEAQYIQNTINQARGVT